MVDPAGGDRGLSGSGTNAAAEAARRAAEEAARQRAAELAQKRAAEAAAAERQRQLAESRQDARLQGVDGGNLYNPTANANTNALDPAAPTYSLTEAQQLATDASVGQSDGSVRTPPRLAKDDWWNDPQPPGSDTVPLRVDRDADVATLVDDWTRESKAEIGMGSTALYDAYMRENGLGLVQAGRIVSPETAPSAQELLDQGDTEGYVNLLMEPTLEAMGEHHPDATFEILTVERGALGTDMPGPHQIYSPQTVVRMTEDGQVQDYVLDADRLFRPTSDDRVYDALVATPGGLDAWNAAEERLEWGQGGGQATYDALASLNTDGADYNITLGVMTMDPAAQSDFLQAYGQTSDIPLGILRPIDPVADEQTILTMDATPLARGEEVTSLQTTFHVDSVDDLALSTALPPMGGIGQQQWRQTIDRLAMNPPADVAELRDDLDALTNGVLDRAALDQVNGADGNALPALLNLVQSHPPAVTFSDELNLSILPGGRGVPPTYESLTYDAATNSVVVDTSVNRFVRGDDRSPELGANYGIEDMPMTIRIPLPEGAPTDWDHPTTEQFALLNGQIQQIGSASVFLHGYQSDRRVWETDMQRWMELSPEPTIGIALAGMGSEGDFLGSGASPLTARQYGFSTMEALDSLGLYGKELNLYGHSMGGAALLQMGLATDHMVAEEGARHPDVNYVLLEPAPSGDSVPFLTERWSRGLIDGTNRLGSTGWLGSGVSSILNGAGAWLIVGDLLPGAPGYIHEVHGSFAGTAGFPQLNATANGLVLQAEADPADVRAFIANNHVLVVGGTQDRIVGTEAVRGFFDGQIFEVPGNHYAHLPTDISEQSGFTDVERRVEEFLAEPDADR